ncbi:DUF1998 domain-containing protein [Halobacteria archaeon AArc-curdl1]|uniref:DUF1998 domain-containing protein n=1 Tax=Natronosalvus hydrolyticus TaxID=2979988 RepID=A0AAP3E6F9_9EURY|nr:DUF1998 domain-containing protein [Halobacteria archaeon AArc-curdl1]
MTDELDDFAHLIGDDEFDTSLLKRESETVEERTTGEIDTKFVKNIRVQRAVPRVEITYQSSSKVQEAHGEILKIEDGEVRSERAIAGHQYGTDGFELQVSKRLFRTYADVTTPEERLAALYSVGYSLRSVMARQLGVNPIEIQCEPHLLNDYLRLLVYDNEPGGAGLSYPIYKNLSAVFDEASMQLETCECSNYCENCLLLPRTPTFLLDKNLLQRELGAALLDMR